MALYIEKREQRSLTTATSGSPRFDLRMVAELGLKDLVNPPEIPFPFRRISKTTIGVLAGKMRYEVVNVVSVNLSCRFTSTQQRQAMQDAGS
ncbi:hypothetical protein MGG_17523 [Pyricularia oryzae 70-15]|uniref:Uncharacterized protein n=3 Tax=Pyricularia oryzae TaxID=318829 RepID=G4NE74_PYRO7|nr:uncharacterized protein MGG_17523 [Pyricularia oryzae 70-15]EHA49403.1 hypothetical protein MGG_17523 [Pyricularia oryzae 70-15]ELQ41590.1 hypothetical protein OOU_Y34scaffold00267g27 [Pyricularia oryzae Y34]KAI7920824.1 hypothetical protein M0657_006403 [Pyricularia oryzae]KAI7927052.1 hypothetical protein M9X92_002384 [Pyricularia oryzae]